MLRRSVLVQKRHLEATTSKCRRLTHQLVYKSGRRAQLPTKFLRSPVSTDLFKPSDTSRTNSVPNTPFQHSLALLAPPEFDLVVDALDSNQPTEQILQLVKQSSLLVELFSRPQKIRTIATELARSQNPRRSIQILHVAHLLGYTLYASAYESVAFHVAQGRRWDVVLAVVGAAKDHIPHITLKLLNWRARALMETQQYFLLRQILQEFQAAGIPPTQLTCHIILSGFMRNNDMEGAKSWLQEMQRSGIPIDSTTHTLINSHRNFNADPEVRQNALTSLPSLPLPARTNVVNRLIKSALDEDNLTSALQYLSLFQTGSVDVINSIFLSHSGMAETPATPSSMNMKPNSDTFAVCMNYFIKKSNIEPAIRLGAEPFSVGIPPTPGLVTSFIHAYFLDGRGDTAVNMLRQLCCASNTKGSWDFLVGNTQPTEECPILNPDQLSLTTRMCNALLRGALNRQGLTSVPPILNIMHANNVIPNERTIEILLSFLNKINVPHPRTLFQLLRALTVTSVVQPSLPHMHSIVSRIFRDEKNSVVPSAWSKRKFPGNNARDALETLRLLGEVEPFDPLSGIQLGAHLSYDTAAKPTVQSLFDRDVKTDGAMIFLRMRRQSVLYSDMESAKALFRTLTARGFRPNAYHVGALVEGYALAGNFRAAMQIMKIASSWGIERNVVMYTSIISAHARRRDLKSATRTFEDMVTLGISPDVASIDALISAFYADGKHDEACKLLKQLWEYIQPFPKALEDADLDTLVSQFRCLGSPSKKSKYKKGRRIALYQDVRRIIQTYRWYFASRREP